MRVIRPRDRNSRSPRSNNGKTHFTFLYGGFDISVIATINLLTAVTYIFSQETSFTTHSKVNVGTLECYAPIITRSELQ